MSAFEEAVLGVLRNHYTRRINFSFEGIPLPNYGRDSTVSVNSSTFERVASAIETGRIKLERISRRGARVPGTNQRYAGRYRREESVMEVPLPATRDRAGRIIHESVHASLTLTRSWNQMWWADEEAAAFIAEQLYLVFTGSPGHPARYPHTVEIFRIARRCANQIHANGDVNYETLDRLCVLIESHPLYR